MGSQAYHAFRGEKSVYSYSLVNIDIVTVFLSTFIKSGFHRFIFFLVQEIKISNYEHSLVNILLFLLYLTMITTQFLGNQNTRPGKHNGAFSCPGL